MLKTPSKPADTTQVKVASQKGGRVIKISQRQSDNSYPEVFKHMDMREYVRHPLDEKEK